MSVYDALTSPQSIYILMQQMGIGQDFTDPGGFGTPIASAGLAAAQQGLNMDRGYQPVDTGIGAYPVAAPLLHGAPAGYDVGQGIANPLIQDVRDGVPQSGVGDVGRLLRDGWNAFVGPESQWYAGEPPEPEPWPSLAVHPRFEEPVRPDPRGDVGVMADNPVPPSAEPPPPPTPIPIGGGELLYDAGVSPLQRPPDPMLEYSQEPPPMFGPQDDMWGALLARGDMNEVDGQLLQELAAANQSQPDPFGDWMNDYNAQTEEMVGAAEQANQKALWFNLAKSFLAEPGNWGQSMAGSMDALNQHSFGKASLHQMEADRDRELLEQNLLFSQIGKNQAQATDDPRSWSEKRYDMQEQMIVDGLMSGEYTPARAEAMLMDAKGFKGQAIETPIGPAWALADGRVMMFGEFVGDMESFNAMIEEYKYAPEQIREDIKSRVGIAEYQAKVDQLVEGGMERKAAEVMARVSNLAGPVNVGMDARMGAVQGSLDDARGNIKQRFIAMYPQWEKEILEASEEELLQLAPEFGVN